MSTPSSSSRSRAKVRSFIHPGFGGAAGHSGPSGNAVGEHAPIVRDRRFHRPGRWQAVVAPLVQSQVYNGY